ncbi:MAG: hypothetical protein IPM39_12770 [Chloroflexi bacterium]|nr:hypothetical protein [Chloroflexota bacterium]
MKAVSRGGLLPVSYTRQVTERAIRGYRGQPARVEQDIRYQVQVKRDEAAISGRCSGPVGVST